MTKEAKPTACAICSVLAMIAESGGINPDDISDAYTEGFADGVLAVLKSRRRELCAAHEGQMDATLASATSAWRVWTRRARRPSSRKRTRWDKLCRAAPASLPAAFWKKN